MLVSSPRNPPGGHGDGADDFPGAIDREIVIENGPSGRLPIGFDQILQLFSDLDLDEITTGRGRLDLDDRESPDRLQAGFKTVADLAPNLRSKAPATSRSPWVG